MFLLAALEKVWGGARNKSSVDDEVTPPVSWLLGIYSSGQNRRQITKTVEPRLPDACLPASAPITTLTAHALHLATRLCLSRGSVITGNQIQHHSAAPDSMVSVNTVENNTALCS